MYRPVTGLFLVLAVSVLLFSGPPAWAYTVSPTVDAHVYSAFPTSSYSTLTYLITGTVGSNNSFAYLKFELPADAILDTAILHLRTLETGNSSNVQLKVLSNDNWNGSVTYNTRPDQSGTVFPSVTTGVSTSVQWFTWDFTGDLSQLSAYTNDGTLSLMLAAGSSRKFSSTNAAPSVSPYLEYTYHLAPVPIPPTVWLLGSALFGVVGLKRKYLGQQNQQ
jgi:hypothetical protein